MTSKYEVTVTRTTTESVVIIVEAEDEDAADLAAVAAAKEKLEGEWDLDDTEYDVNEITVIPADEQED